MSLIGSNLTSGARSAGNAEAVVVLSPATEKVVAQFTSSTSAEVDAAVATARAAQPSWAALSPDSRSAVPHPVVDGASQENLEELITAEDVDTRTQRVRLRQGERGRGTKQFTLIKQVGIQTTG
ncbi:aldehyde dehydrogenase family protein [Streptomyces malaysiensis]|uniref:aldehyde dehydrogenase family protein n=1 Tax=Streptomyces malaysiensis TaxID=92644 RepID=UPI002B2E1C43|nr:aldehyde dehydrogenase family protein [Streptomyces malaysiensis]